MATEGISGLASNGADLEVRIDGGVATLWLNRPGKRNAVTYDMWVGIAEHCRQLAQDPTVRLLVVRGVGDHFCAGADVAGLSVADSGDYHRANVAADDALGSFPKPTLAVITGSCVGGGVEIAVACDLRIADTTARLGITPARLGLVYPAVGVERVVRLIGPAAAKHLLYTADLIDPDWALRMGLIDRLYTSEALSEGIDALVDLLAHHRSLLTQMASKEMVDAAVLGPIDPEISRRWQRELAKSSESTEGISAFLEHREPNFTWVPPACP